jgi:hypothetical protein
MALFQQPHDPCFPARTVPDKTDVGLAECGVMNAEGREEQEAPSNQ